MPNCVYCVFFRGARAAIHNWPRHPGEMAIKIGMSLVLGQGIFWVFGSDQLGFFMDPKLEFGVGERIAGWVVPHLPPGAVTAWTLKVIEILTDGLRAITEGAVYHQHQMAPDGVAAFFTPGIWTGIYEVGEKITGVIVHPERVDTAASMRLSVSNIYGSVFRYAMAAAMYKYGGRLYDYVIDGSHYIGRLLGRTDRGKED